MNLKPNKEQLDLALNIVKDPNCPATVLSSHLGLSSRIDMALAQHKNSTPEILLKLSESGGDGVCQRLVKNPNFPSGNIYAKLANNYPEEFLKIKNVATFPASCPDRLIGLTSILTLESCPKEIIEYLSLHGTKDQKETIYRAGHDPDGVITKITPKMLTHNSLNSAVASLDFFVDECFDEGKKHKVLEYLNRHSPYAAPKFIPQDRTRLEHRKANLLGGYPFTSGEYPWPLTDGSGLPMQPIIQIDLLDASRILSWNLGGGLLQVWGRVDSDRKRANANKNPLVMLRLIPAENMSSNLYDDFPDELPWALDKIDINSDAPCPIFYEPPEQMRVGSVIKWIGLGDMWELRFSLSFDTDVDFYYLQESLSMHLQEFIVTPETGPTIYLGGNGGQSGGWEDSTICDDGSRLLFRANFKCGMNIGITVKLDKYGLPKFEPVVRYFY